MRAKDIFAVGAIFALGTAAAAARSATRKQSEQAAQAKSGNAAQTPGRAASLRSETRLITVDVSVRDPHGHPVRGLKASDFQIYDDGHGPQQIAAFEFMERPNPAPTVTSARHAGSEIPATEGTKAQPVYSNQDFTHLAVPPTAILVDPQNIAFGDQLWAHKQVMKLLDLLPAKTPVAIFLLGSGLTVMQNFTTDRTLLRAAVNRSIAVTRPAKNPQTGGGMTPAYFDAQSAQNVRANRDRRDFEQLNYAAQTTVIADRTSDALKAIASHLAADPGPKNLVWVSEAFPEWILPAAGFAPVKGPLATSAGQEFQGSGYLGDKLRSDAQALVNARVTVYPVDARGLVPPHLYDASSNFYVTNNLSGQDPGLVAQAVGGELAREDADLVESLATAEQIADDTGGSACWNTNNLAGCATSAIENGAPDYEISYYPAGVKWDGSFHRIQVKTDVRGATLRYERGYSAISPAEEAKKQMPAVFNPVCASLLPVTSIGLRAEPLAQFHAKVSRYLLSISPNELSVTPSGNRLELHLRVGICEYDPRSKGFTVHVAAFSKDFSDRDAAEWQKRSIETVIRYESRPDVARLRLVVFDPSTGATGSVDVPAHPSVVYSTLQLSAAGRSAEAGGAPEIYSSLQFQSVNGEKGELDLTGGRVEYRGKLSMVLSSVAFFNRVYGKKFQCEGGKLTADDRQSSEQPNLRFAFTNEAGLMALVDLTGTQPSYAGTLPMAASARAFFEQLWKACHCQAQ